MKEDTCDHPAVASINAKIAEEAENGFRRHLGASVIGQKCPRKIWYSFRWAFKSTFSPRMLRLFGRGHREEFAFVDLLRKIGVEVHEYAQPDYVLAYHDASESYIKMAIAEWESRQFGSEPLDDVTGDAFHEEAARRRGVDIPEKKQIKIIDIDGHFGGSLDGEAFFLPQITQLLHLPYDEKGLVEFKTHGEKSYEKLITDGVKIAKPEHYAQMCTYMEKRGLKFAMYMAVCKNDDRLYCEYVMANPEHGREMIEKARQIIYSRVPPPRISKTPTWFECKFCDARPQCFFSAPLEKNCRTCVNVAPAPDGRWYCAKWQSLIPSEAEISGCGHYQAIRD